MMRHFFLNPARAAGLFFLAASTNLFATTFPLPAENEALLGQVQYFNASSGDSATTVAERYNIGLNAVVAANPGVAESTTFANGTKLKIATQFLLPSLPRRGIIINLPEMRMYYFPDNGSEVMTFPIGIGKIGKTIPIENTSIARKKLNPVWIPPADIREYNKAQGVDLPKVMAAGPDNPLGPYGIYLRIPTFLIHSTIFPESIGRRASFGCIRMNESDIKQFFPEVQAGTPVTIVDMPNKFAWSGNALYLEAHEPLSERSEAPDATLAGAVRMAVSQLPKGRSVLIDWQLIAYLAESPDGIPHEVGKVLN